MPRWWREPGDGKNEFYHRFHNHKAFPGLFEMLLIGHRGASHDAPENTLMAFELAWQEGADGIEADFRLTRDSQIVCIHDENIKRTAGIDLVIADSLLKDLRRLDGGMWKDIYCAGTRIPTLSEVLAILPAGKKLYIEIKSGFEILSPLANALAESKVEPEQILILAFDQTLIAKVKKRLPQYKACWLTDYRWSRTKGGWQPSREAVLDVLRISGADGLASRACSVVDESFVKLLRDAGMEIHIWTVDNAAKAKAFLGLHVDSIITNRPGWMRKKLDL